MVYSLKEIFRGENIMVKTIFYGTYENIENVSLETAKGFFLNEKVGYEDIWTTGYGSIEYYINDKLRYILKICLATDYDEFVLCYTDMEEQKSGWFPLGNPKTLDEWQEAGEGLFMREGTFVEPFKAWLIVEDFLKTGQRTDKVEWIAGIDLPEAKTENPGA